MKNTIENNRRKWDVDYSWPKDGDEWDGQARHSGVAYEDWKASIVETFLVPDISAASVVLEIGPGHGRWSAEIVHRCKRLILVDLSPTCIDYCRQRLAEFDNVEYLVNDGRSLGLVGERSVDFIWSYDTFVHLEAGLIDDYLGEFHRVLRPGGRAIIHHAGRNHLFLRLGFLRSLGAAGIDAYRLLSMGKLRDNDGWRSDVSARTIRRSATRRGLRVVEQVQSWGQAREFGVERYGDYVTTLESPSTG